MNGIQARATIQQGHHLCQCVAIRAEHKHFVAAGQAVHGALVVSHIVKDEDNLLTCGGIGGAHGVVPGFLKFFRNSDFLGCYPPI